VLIVPSAEQADPVRPVETRSREAVQVIEFQGASLRAPAAMLVGERAAATVALEDLSFDGVRDVTRRRCVGAFGRSLSRLPARRESFFLDVLDRHVERRLEDRRQVSVGNAVTEQVLQLAELLMTRATPGELEFEGVLGERLNDGPAFIASRRRSRWRCEHWSGRRLGHRRWSGSAERECGCGLRHQVGATRKLPHDARNRGLWRKTRNHLFDLALRLARRLRQDLLLVLGGQLRREQAQSGQVHLPGPECLQDHRHASRGAGEVDPVAGDVLGETELADAEGEHRGERPVEVELPLIDLSEMDEKRRLDSV